MGHLVVASKNIQVEQFPGDCLGPFYHEFSVARNPLRIAGPNIAITDRPGLGIDVDWHCVQEHRAE